MTIASKCENIHAYGQLVFFFEIIHEKTVSKTKQNQMYKLTNIESSVEKKFSENVLNSFEWKFLCSKYFYFYIAANIFIFTFQKLCIKVSNNSKHNTNFFDGAY